MQRNHSLLIILGLGSFLSACGSQEYYVPVDNYLGEAQSLSKSDTIRVIIPHNYPDNIRISRKHDKGWLNYDHAARYQMSAKEYTEDRLQTLGYHVVDTGLHPKNDGQPNIIALVESSEDPSKQHDVVRTWETPMFTDTNGNPTQWETHADSYTLKHIDYKVKLVRPIGQNNDLLKCITDNGFSTGFCIAPEHPNDYQTIFEGKGSMDTDNRSPSYILDHITTAVWHNYPNMMGQNKVFLYIENPPRVVRVEPDTPKK